MFKSLSPLVGTDSGFQVADAIDLLERKDFANPMMKLLINVNFSMTSIYPDVLNASEVLCLLSIRIKYLFFFLLNILQ